MVEESWTRASCDGFNPLNQVYRLNETGIHRGLPESTSFNPLNQVYHLNTVCLAQLYRDTEVLIP